MDDLTRSPALRLTPEQEEATSAEADRMVVEAGAGTGKTAVLVERFLHLLDKYPDWPLDSILAITFTEKATREMRSRIRQAIEARATEPNASPHWRERRRRLDLLQVTTIHGLCARILRENAIAAGLDPQFEVLDEKAAALWKTEAVDSALRDLVSQDSPALALLDSLRLVDVKEELLALLDKRGTVGEMFDRLPEPSEIVTRWHAGAAGMMEQIWMEMSLSSPRIGSLDDFVSGAVCIDPEDKLVPAVRAVRDASTLAKKGDLAGAAVLIDGINLAGGKAANWGGKEVLRTLKEDLAVVRTAVRERLLPFLPVDESQDAAAADALQHWRNVWDAVTRAYDKLRSARSSLDFDDLELLAERLLAGEQTGERMRATLAGIRHVMVDEFQDVNQRQGRIIAALAPGSSAAGLFVVGDAKQSIYRFRQAQVAVFTRTSAEVARLTGREPVALTRSFRTHRDLVAAVNVAFDRILLPTGAGYTEFEARPAPLAAPRVFPGDDPPVELMLVPFETDDGQKVNAEDGRLWEAAWLAGRIQDLSQKQRLVWDKGTGAYRPLRYGDVAVLFRASTYLPLYEEVLSAAGLPYLTVSGSGYYDRPEVQDLISLLECLNTPGDDLSLAAALRSPMFNLNDETLYRLRIYEADGARSKVARPLDQSLLDPPLTHQSLEVAHAAATIAQLRKMTGRADVWTLLRAAMDLTAYEVIVCRLEDSAIHGALARRSGRALANVNKFMSLARDASGTSLSEFLGRLRDLRAREAREGEAVASSPEEGAIQLMSIHAAKGLEFPVVAIVDLGRAKDGGASRGRIIHDPAFDLACRIRDEAGDWQDSTGYRWGRWLDGRMEDAERKRLLYVAMTRAADLLLLSGRLASKAQPPAGSWLSELLPAWQIDTSGDGDETIQREGFRVRVHRPSQPTEVNQAWPEPQPLASASLVPALPALVRPVPIGGQLTPIFTVSDVAARTTGADSLGLPRQNHALLRHSGDVSRGDRGSTVGKVVHRALADWRCLEEPGRLTPLLDRWAVQESADDQDDDLPVVVQRAAELLRELRGSSIFLHVMRAQKRYAELPFSLMLPDQILEGKIDMLFQDEQGTWSLVEWKTDHPRSGVTLEHAAEEHVVQVAIYAEAVRRLLDVEPRAYLCLLARRAVVYEYPKSRLDSALSSLVLPPKTGIFTI